jgi:hypothetical protein
VKRHLAVLVAAITIGCVAVTTPSPAPGSSSPSVIPPVETTSASVCAGKDPTANVYHAYRLVLITPCMTVTGTVATVRHEPDGDVHIGLRLDAGQEALINDKNRTGQGGNLVLEIICSGTVTQADAVTACSTYTNMIQTPTVGAHITVTGPYVLDTTHGWTEIHPVWVWRVAR